MAQFDVTEKNPESKMVDDGQSFRFLPPRSTDPFGQRIASLLS